MRFDWFYTWSYIRETGRSHFTHPVSTPVVSYSLIGFTHDLTGERWVVHFTQPVSPIFAILLSLWDFSLGLTAVLRDKENDSIQFNSMQVEKGKWVKRNSQSDSLFASLVVTQKISSRQLHGSCESSGRLPTKLGMASHSTQLHGSSE